MLPSASIEFMNEVSCLKDYSAAFYITRLLLLLLHGSQTTGSPGMLSCSHKLSLFASLEQLLWPHSPSLSCASTEGKPRTPSLFKEAQTPPIPEHTFCSLDSPIFTAETQEAIKVSSTWQSPRTRWCSPGSYKAFINKMTPNLSGLHNDSLLPPSEDPGWGGGPVDCYSHHHCQNILLASEWL